VAVAVYGTISNAVIAGRSGAAPIVDATAAVFWGVLSAAVVLLIAAWALPAHRRATPVTPAP
jgi:hypothetical protein